MRIKKWIKYGSQLLGVQENNSGHLEKIISIIGGFGGITAVFLVSHNILGDNGASMIVASMGASSVLLFAVPHGPLSQPWAVLCGHTLSAAIGVTCGIFLNDQYFAAAIAVGISIGAMHYMRCIHPPGGATALTAVIGGSAIQTLGYKFVFEPVLLNAFIIVFFAIIINLPFRSRRYPLALSRYVDRKNGLNR